MAKKQVVLTEEGLKKLQDELEYLKVTKRKEITEKIKEARGFGDLSENSEYDAAKDAQATMEQRVVEIENLIKNATVVSADQMPTDVVSITSKVVVEVCDDGEIEKEEYIIVGATESDPLSGKISDESPIGKALLGKKVDDSVEVDTPGGAITIKILEIK